MSDLPPHPGMPRWVKGFAIAGLADREASRPAVMIPVAGTVAGANGTRFQTDLTIANKKTGSSTGPAVSWIDVYWLPRDASGSGTPVTRLALAHHAVEFYEDFVTRTLNRSGVGAIWLTQHPAPSYTSSGRWKERSRRRPNCATRSAVA